jgi:signal transduction histidine kinase
VNGILRTVMLAAGVAIVGAVISLVVSAALGMEASETARVAAALIPAAAATVLAAALAPRVLRRAPLIARLLAVAVLAIVVALANLSVLATDMVVTGHAAKLLAVLLVYALGSGIAVAVALARTVRPSFARLERTARALGDGDLNARVGDLEAGAELDTLARTLDEMASRLQRAQDREHEVEGMRTDLITAVSHDLRTPLASMRAMVEAIDDRIVRDPPSLTRYAAEMRRSVAQLSTMVDDLFELTQVDAGAIEVETRRARLDELVRTAVATVDPHVASKGVALQTDLSDVADVLCSPRLARVLQNLLMNAVRHTPADGSVRLSAERHAGMLELRVEDSGTGIDAMDLDRIFEPFYRADPARSGPGAGLGLALAKRIVEALGGGIRAERLGAGGARFAVVLPLT